MPTNEDITLTEVWEQATREAEAYIVTPGEELPETVPPEGPPTDDGAYIIGGHAVLLGVGVNTGGRIAGLTQPPVTTAEGIDRVLPRRLPFSVREKINALRAVAIPLRQAINAYEQALGNWDRPEGIDANYIAPLRKSLRETEAEIAYLEDPDRATEGQAPRVDFQRVHRAPSNYPLFVPTQAGKDYVLGVAATHDVDERDLSWSGDTPNSYAYLQ